MSAAQRVLIIEDEPDLVRLIEYNLVRVGFEVTSTGLAQEGLRLCLAAPPDLVVLDLMLPDGSGLDVCRTLKSTPSTRAVPVLIVTARGEEIDRVVGFELGADDYVVKPFSVRELVLRIRAVLRRSETEASVETVTVFGKLKVDRDAHRVFVAESEVTLTSLEFRLLSILMDRPNRVQSREGLLRDVWGLHMHVETRTVDTHIKRLREKLGEAGDYILTVRGAGYRFASSPESLG